MEIQKELDFKGLRLELLQADIDKEDFPRERFRAILRIKNVSETKKKISIKEDSTKYISRKYGLEYAYQIIPYQFARSDGEFITPDSFVDIKIRFDIVKESYSGDRMEIELRDLAMIPLFYLDNQWYWSTNEIEYFGSQTELRQEITREEKKLLKKQLKSKIEHFESIDEKFGLSLQNFSFEITNWNTLQIFCEVLTLNGETPKEDFHVDLVIYDSDHAIVSLENISKDGDDFKGFEIFEFGPIELDFPIDEISKIRIYPTR